MADSLILSKILSGTRALSVINIILIFLISNSPFKAEEAYHPPPASPDSLRNDSTKCTPRLTFNYDNIKSYIFEHLEYPAEARENEITGEVHIRFTIDTIGNIKNIIITQPIHPLLDQEAIRLIKNMPPWKPILYQDKPQRYTYTIPVIFELKD